MFDNKLWIMGGGQRLPETIPTNDVWCSEDGKNWIRVTASGEWEPRLWFSTVVYRGLMWIIGEWSEEKHNFGDVWYLKDGKHWKELKSDVIWSPRHEHSAMVFNEKIWVVGVTVGSAYEINSEVWSLFIPED